MTRSSGHLMIKAIVYCLVGFPERYYIVNHLFGRFLFDKNTGHEICYSFHFLLFHPQSCDFSGTNT